MLKGIIIKIDTFTARKNTTIITRRERPFSDKTQRLRHLPVIRGIFNSYYLHKSV